MSLEILKKTEAWKFSPVDEINSLKLPAQEGLSLNEVLESKLAIGPSEQQIHTVTWQDLVDQGLVNVSQVQTDQDYFYEDQNTKRAHLDRTLEDRLSPNQSYCVKFKKSPPSILWLNPVLLGSNFEFELDENVSAEILMFETEDSNTSPALLPKISFKLRAHSKLELGLSKSSTKQSFSLINILMQDEAKLKSYSFCSGEAKYKRLEMNVFQTGKESSCSLNGLNSTKDSNIYDFHSNIFHINTDQNSSQNFKAICKDQSKSIFTGRVHLTENSSGAQVDQINNNLLVNKKSAVDTQPELNIYQDNVKATHGATTSSMEDSHLFYFSSRGFKPEQSKQLLLQAFCKSTCDNLTSKGLKDFFLRAIDKDISNRSSKNV